MKKLGETVNDFVLNDCVQSKWATYYVGTVEKISGSYVYVRLKKLPDGKPQNKLTRFKPADLFIYKVKE